MYASRLALGAFVGASLLGAGCASDTVSLAPHGQGGAPTPTAGPTATPKPGTSPTPRPTATPTATPTPRITATPTPAPTPTSPPASASITYSLSPNAGTYPLPSVAGLGGSLSLPASTPVAGAANPAQLTLTVYSGATTGGLLAGTVLPTFFNEVQGTPLLYVVASSTAVTFGSFSGSLTLTSSRALASSVQYYAGACTLSGNTSGGAYSTCSTEPAGASIYTIVGPIPQSGNTLTANTQTFLAAPGSLGLGPPSSLSAPGGQTYLAFVYSSPLGPQLQSRRTRGFRGNDPAVSFIGRPMR